MRKRVLLATWYQNHNYGTALQAYALKKVIEQPQVTGIYMDAYKDIEIECDLLPHTPVREKKKTNRWKKIFSTSFYQMKVQQYKDKKIYERKINLFKIREKAFRIFIDNNFTFAMDYDLQTSQELKEVAHNYDFVISGSDQIWNPEALDSTYLLEWVEANKKFSYGSSLSVKQIPKHCKEIYRRALSGFKKISIRDSACCQQLSSIVGKEVVTVVDPVVLLGRNGLSNQIVDINSEPYVFCYFLGNNRKHRNIAVEVAEQLGLKIKAIINAGSDYAADAKLEHCADWDADPWKFVSYINSAELIVTDSFHATVISIMFKKNFVVLEKDVNRPEQNNRILEFLNLVGLESRWGIDGIYTSISMEQWKYADEIIEMHRRDSFRYLMEALS